MRVVLVLLGLLLIGCGQPRAPILQVEQVKDDRRKLTVEIVKVFDSMMVTRSTETSHLIEVKILEGPQDLVGKNLTFPYDEWMVGAAPPKERTTMTMSPAEWVQKSAKSRGKPVKGWGNEGE
jgi:hypothetical protein